MKTTTTTDKDYSLTVNGAKNSPIALHGWGVVKHTKQIMFDNSQGVFDFGDKSFDDFIDLKVFNDLRVHLMMLEDKLTDAKHVIQIERYSIELTDREVVLMSVRKLSGILEAANTSTHAYRVESNN